MAGGVAEAATERPDRAGILPRRTTLRDSVPLLATGDCTAGSGAAATSEACAGQGVAISPPLFQELAIVSGQSPGANRGLEVVLPDGCRLRVPAEVDRALLADVLSVLESRRC